MKKQPIVSSTKKQIPNKSKSYSYLALLPMLLLSIFANAASVQWQIWPASQQALGTPEVVSAQAMDATNVPTGQMIIYASMTPDVCMAAGDAITAQKSGTCTIMASIDDNSASMYQSWPVTKAPATISLSFSSSVYVGESVAITATVPGNLPVTLSVSSANCAIDGSMSIKALSAGTCNFTATSDGNEVYDSAVANGSFNISRKSQTITASLLPSPVFVTDTFIVSPTSDSGLSVDVNASGACSNIGNSIIANNEGTCTVSYNQAGSAEYSAAAEVIRTTQVTKKAQTISLNPTLPSTLFVNDEQATGASSSAGLPVAIAVSGDCTFNGSTLKALAQGGCTVSFSQAGNAEYLAATSITETITIEKRAQTITPSLLPSSVFVTDTFSVGATTDASLDVDMTVAGSCTLAASTVTANAEGSCTVTYSQPGNAEYLAAPMLTKTVNIQKKPQTLDIVAPTASIFDELFDVSATASSGLTPVSIAPSGGCSFDDGSSTENSAQLVATAAGSCTVTFTQAGNIEFAATNASHTVIINKANQDINILTGIPEHGTINVDYPVSAEASSNLAVAITVSGDCIKVGNNVRPKTPAAGSGSCVVSYTQAGDSNYNPALTLTESMIVQVGQTINITQLPPVSGQFDATVQTAATTSSGLPVHISVDDQYCKLSPEPALGDNFVLGTAGINLTAIGTCKITYSQPGGEIGGVWFDPAPTLNRTVTVDRWNQNIKITRKPPASQQAGTAVVVEAVAEPADAENPRPVTITIAAGSSCTMQSSAANEATVVLGTTGSSCTLYFNQSGNALYKPAPQLSKTITISQVTDGSNIGNYWPSHKLFTTGISAAQRQPIMAPPMVARNGDIKAPEPNVMVIFGTGKYHEESDLSDKTLHAIYGIHDRGEYNLTRYNKKTGSEKLMLAKRVFSEKSFTVAGVTQNNRKVSGDAVDWVHQYGWYVDLASDLNNNGSIDASEKLGERSVFRPFIANKLYVFNTVLPTVGTCSGATQGWTMLIDWASGLAPNFATYDANMDGSFDSADKGFVGYYNETAGSELGRGGDSIYDTSGSEARRRSVTFGTADSGIRLGWEEKTPYGVLKRDAN